MNVLKPEHDAIQNRIPIKDFESNFAQQDISGSDLHLVGVGVSKQFFLGVKVFNLDQDLEVEALQHISSE